MQLPLKRVLAAATALLLIGAGCAGYQQTAVEKRTAPAPTSEEAAMMAGKSDVDAVADAYVEGATQENTVAAEETGDAALLDSSDTELNAYGQVYDANEF